MAWSMPKTKSLCAGYWLGPALVHEYAMAPTPRHGRTGSLKDRLATYEEIVWIT